MTGNVARDSLVHALTADGALRCLAAVTTELVGEACRRHRTFPTSSVALGRALTGALLIGSSFKDLERITVHFDCEGPLGNVVTQSDPNGNVRGYVSNPEADATAMNALGKFDVRAIVGGGTLYVTREAGFDIGLMKEPYRGTVPIVSGEIGEDLAYYLSRSEQIDSAVSLGTFMRLDAGENDTEEAVWNDVSTYEFSLDRLRVSAAGGYVIQVMPDAEGGALAYLEECILKAPSSTDMVRAGLSPVAMLETVLGTSNLDVLDERQPRFFCQCSRERALLIISALGRDDVGDMLTRDNGAELVCHFCNETYRITADELSAILAEL